jgi:hypothetical protein
MIRIELERQELIDRINAISATWIGRAKKRTDKYAQSRNYTGGNEFWGEIKKVYIDVQYEKCAYCETKLQGAVLASKVHEVEHFRPKSSISSWPDRKREYWKDFPKRIQTGAADTQGYYLLAYHPFNYAIACTRCNSTLKSNYFPIRGRRTVALADPSHDKDENCLLVYPLSDLAPNPNKILTFDGVLAVPINKTGAMHDRAVTTIWFFQLNHEDLTTRRAEMLVPLWNILEAARNGPSLKDRIDAQQTLDRACGPKGQFSACMAAFRKLYDHDPAGARVQYDLAKRLLI